MQLYEVTPFILEVDCLKQDIMPCIWVACIAMNTLIFYGIFIMHTFCIWDCKENPQASGLIEELQKECKFNINWF